MAKTPPLLGADAVLLDGLCEPACHTERQGHDDPAITPLQLVGPVLPDLDVDRVVRLSGGGRLHLAAANLGRGGGHPEARVDPADPALRLRRRHPARVAAAVG